MSLQRVGIADLGPGTARVLLLRFQGDTCQVRCRCRCSVGYPNGPLDMERPLSEVLHKLQVAWRGMAWHGMATASVKISAIKICRETTDHPS